MKQLFIILKTSYIVACLLYSFISYSQTVINSENFFLTWGIWNDGGTDCSLVLVSPLNLTQSANIQGKSSSSNMTTDGIDLTTYGSVVMSFDFRTSNFSTGEDFWVRFSNDGGSVWTTVKAFVRGTDFNNDTNYTNVTVTFDSTINSFTANSKFRFQCDASSSSDDVYIDNVTITGYPPTPEINVKGLGNSIVGDGTNTPMLSNNTDFGTAQISSQTITKTFVIENTGSGDLTLGSISLSGLTEFTIDSSPSPGSIVSSGGTANIVVLFSTSSIGIQTDLLTINSDDSNESSYQINITATGAKVFFDSDGDSIYDDVDIDDDNDGILDSDEQIGCKNSSSTNEVIYKFLEETFGAGERTTIDITYDAITTYCYEDGTASCASLGGNDLNDGEYTVYYKAANGDGTNQTPVEEVANWADAYWYTGEDHTQGDTNGRMAMFNAAIDPGVFYTAHIIGTFANVPITYSFWVLNLDRSDAPGIETRLRPDILVEFRDMSNNLITSITTGEIAPTTAGNLTGDWYQFTADLNLGVTEFQVIFTNNQLGGTGNDLAIDDIEIKQTLCDHDNDGISDVFDLDSDNDGIPDVIETGLGIYSEGKATLTNVSSWVDANANGMHDLFESQTPIDTDSDGIPDYLDLDSDNDGIFDVDEYGAINSNDSSFQNGDGDVSGNGVGDGIDSETFREKDSDGDDILEGFGDGILDCFDFFEGNTNYADSFGNNNQGTGPLYALDSDNDGIPDYRDIYNDITGIYDIDTVEIYASLPHTNGVLDDTTDADGDGVMASRDGDDSVYGSPRNLDASYSLYFDGRNDYVEDGNLISSGEATLMVFIKSGGTNTNNNDRIIAGQDNLYLQVNSDNTVTAVAEGVSLISTTILTDGIWTHVTVTTKSGETILYINGIQETSDTSGGITDSSNFFIGSSSSNNNYFKGEIDEVRVFNSALSIDDVKKMAYQELDESNSFNRGKIVPIDISGSIGSSLIKYYKMDSYQDDILDDKKTSSIDVAGAKIYNVKDIYFQRAPLPYQTISDGNWTDSATWLYGSEWDITSKQNNSDDTSIVHIKNNINLDGSYNTQGMVGLIVDSGKEFSIEGNKGLYNSFYLKLDGLIDLDNESQLIQSINSVLDVTSSGKIERDQQGTKDLFTYNYWSSPVGISNTSTNNNSYKLPNVLKDGSVPASPLNITFLTSGYNGAPGAPGVTPISIADYWIWKYSNQLSNSYPSWQHVRSTGTLLAGEGFTMKGVENTSGVISLEQNYVFNGKPNNGDISLTLSAGNDYLIGNPYASAIDANEFILDNINSSGGRATSDIIDGSLYFWEHFASSTHVLAEYRGGYGTYTLIGGTKAISNDSRLDNNGELGTKTPQRYIPVSQGFFVTANTGGNISFKNSQRVFKTESSDSSVFMKSSNIKEDAENSSNNGDIREKIRLRFDSPYHYHRQLLVGVDSKASNDIDLGYDAILIENNKEDMFWVVNNQKLVIQGVNSFNQEQKLPLGVKIYQQGLASIKIDGLENIPNNLNIYIHDNQLGIIHNLKESNYEAYLTPGTFTDRFEIQFDITPEISLGTDEIENNTLNIFYSNNDSSLILYNPNLKLIKSVQLLNILGQSVYEFNNVNNINIQKFKTNRLIPGAYIINLKTSSSTITKKVLVN
ncbi:LamG-like jellyroll fold domain-containing protein [Gaetbulibacter sp. M235]|uniref:LamG-like jellyroll fold domain-containing protein n=1 Tax=Gaetbulibacter sp. M235 TaxID=3126510 RepID=UPI00374E2E0B